MKSFVSTFAIFSLMLGFSAVPSFAQKYNKPQLEHEIIHGFGVATPTTLEGAYAPAPGEPIYPVENQTPEYDEYYGLEQEYGDADEGIEDGGYAYDEEFSNAASDSKTAREFEEKAKSNKPNEYYIRLGMAFGSFSEDNNFKGIACDGNYDVYWGCDSISEKPEVGLAGNYKDYVAIEAAVGKRFSNFLRADVSFSVRDDLEFEENENYGYKKEAYHDTDCSDNRCEYSRTVRNKLDNKALFANLYIEPMRSYESDGFNIKKKTFVPYVGAGIGLAFNDLHDIIIEGDALYDRVIDMGNPINYEGPYTRIIQGNDVTEVAYMFTIGSEFNFSNSFGLDINLKYLNLGMVETGDNYYNGFDADANNDGEYDVLNDYLYPNGDVVSQGMDQLSINKMQTELEIIEFGVGLKYEF
jgi:opacity protein-like surface antigen